MQNNTKNNTFSKFREILGENKWEEFIKKLEDWFEGILGKDFDIDLKNWKIEYKRDKHNAINTAITAKTEEYLKTIICPRIPKWVTPDHLTVLGVIAVLICSAGFILGFINRNWLFLVPIGLILNWFGDSFDGSIARYRNRTRPNYGYYIDKIVDSVVILIFVLGVGLSGFVKIEIALIFACVYMMLMLHVDLVAHIQNQAKNSFGLIGPTEIRIIGIFVAIAMYFIPISYFNIYGHWVTQYDFIVLGMSLVMFLVLFVNIFSKGVELHKFDTKDW